MDIKDIIRVGIVSSVNGAAHTVRVTFGEVDGLVSGDLPVLTSWAQNVKAYSLPAVGEQVLCVFLPNTGGNGVKNGFILGGFYNKADKPCETSEAVTAMRWPDGSYIRYENGTIEIHGATAIKLTAPRIDLN